MSCIVLAIQKYKNSKHLARKKKMKMFHVGCRVMLNHLLKIYKIQKIDIYVNLRTTFLNSYQYSISIYKPFVTTFIN